MADDKKKKSTGGSLFKLLIGVVLIVGLAAGAIYVYGTTLEKHQQFERSVVIEGDVDDIHAMVGDLKKWDEWGPWRAADPDIKYTYSDTTTEAGSKMNWTMEEGSGSLEFTKVDEDKGVEYKFQWEEWTPSDGAVTYEQLEDGKVKVTWSFDADMTDSVMGRLALSYGRADMEKMFDDGLKNLKQKVEAK